MTGVVIWGQSGHRSRCMRENAILAPGVVGVGMEGWS